MTVERFTAFWRKVSPDLSFPGTKAGEEPTYNEWADGNGNKFQGMREPGGAKHGIVRTIDSVCDINEATFYEGKKHGLCLTWWDDRYPIAFMARIFDHGERKAFINWRADWSVITSDNKELILENNGLNIFKP